MGLSFSLRHFLGKSILLKFYFAYIQPIIQHGVFVYGCTSTSKLAGIKSLQKKYKVHLYELLKIVLKAKNGCSRVVADFYEDATLCGPITRSQTKDLVSIPANARKFPLKFESAKLYKYLRKAAVLPSGITLNAPQISVVAHVIKDTSMLHDNALKIELFYQCTTYRSLFLHFHMVPDFNTSHECRVRPASPLADVMQASDV